MNNMVESMNSLRADGNLTGNERDILEEISKQEKKSLDESFSNNNIEKKDLIDIVVNEIDSCLLNSRMNEYERNKIKELGLNIVAKLDYDIDENSDWEDVVDKFILENKVVRLLEKDNMEKKEVDYIKNHIDENPGQANKVINKILELSSVTKEEYFENKVAVHYFGGLKGSLKNSVKDFLKRDNGGYTNNLTAQEYLYAYLKYGNYGNDKESNYGDAGEGWRKKIEEKQKANRKQTEANLYGIGENYSGDKSGIYDLVSKVNDYVGLGVEEGYNNSKNWNLDIENYEAYYTDVPEYKNYGEYKKLWKDSPMGKLQEVPEGIDGSINVIRGQSGESSFMMPVDHFENQLQNSNNSMFEINSQLFISYYEYCKDFNSSNDKINIFKNFREKFSPENFQELLVIIKDNVDKGRDGKFTEYLEHLGVLEILDLFEEKDRDIEDLNKDIKDKDKEKKEVINNYTSTKINESKSKANEKDDLELNSNRISKLESKIVDYEKGIEELYSNYKSNTALIRTLTKTDNRDIDKSIKEILDEKGFDLNSNNEVHSLIEEFDFYDTDLSEIKPNQKGKIGRFLTNLIDIVHKKYEDELNNKTENIEQEIRNANLTKEKQIKKTEEIDKIDESKKSERSNIYMTFLDLEIIKETNDVEQDQIDEFSNRVSTYIDIDNSDILEYYKTTVKDKLELDSISMAGLQEFISLGKENIDKFLENEKSKEFLKEYLQGELEGKPSLDYGDQILPSMYEELLYDNDSDKSNSGLSEGSRGQSKNEINDMSKEQISAFFEKENINDNIEEIQYKLLTKGPWYLSLENKYTDKIMSYWKIPESENENVMFSIINKYISKESNKNNSEDSDKTDSNIPLGFRDTGTSEVLNENEQAVEILTDNFDYDSLKAIKDFMTNIINGKDFESSYDAMMLNIDHIELKSHRFNNNIKFSDYLMSLIDSTNKDINTSFDIESTTDTYMNHLSINEEEALKKLKHDNITNFTNIFGLENYNIDSTTLDNLNEDFEEKIINALKDYKIWKENREKGKEASPQIFLLNILYGDKDKQEQGIIKGLVDKYKLIEKLEGKTDKDFDKGFGLNENKHAPDELFEMIVDMGENESNSKDILKFSKNSETQNIVNSLYDEFDKESADLYLENIDNVKKFQLEALKKYFIDWIDKAYSSNKKKLKFTDEKTEKLFGKLDVDLDDKENNIFLNWRKSIKNLSINDFEEELEEKSFEEILNNKIISINKENMNKLKNHDKEKWKFQNFERGSGIGTYFTGFGDYFVTNTNNQIKENYQRTSSKYRGKLLEVLEDEQKDENKGTESLDTFLDDAKSTENIERKFELEYKKRFGKNTSETKKEETQDIENDINLQNNDIGYSELSSTPETNYKNSNYAVSKKIDEKGNTIGWSLKLGDDEDSEVIEVEKKENINDNVRILEKLLERKGIDVDLVSKDRSKSMEASIFDKYKKIQDLSKTPEKIDFELIEGAIMQGIRKWVVDKVDNTKEDDLKVPASTMSKIKSSQTNRSIEGLSEFFAKLKTTQKDWKDKNNMYYDAVSADDVGTSNGLIVMIEELEEMRTIDEVYSMSNSSL